MDATDQSEPNKIERFEEGWPVMGQIIKKKFFDTDVEEGVSHDQFTVEEFMNSYNLVYDMCTSNNPPAAQVPEKLYRKYQKTCEDYVSSKVMPHLRGKNGEILLKELVQQWGKYKTMRTSLSRIFHYLDRYFCRPLLPSLQETSHLVFYRLVYGEMNGQVRRSVIYEINRERKGEKIDQAVVKNVVEIYMEMAEDSIKYYEKDFETAMLTDTARFYSQMALELRNMNLCSHKLYLQKVDDSLTKEEIRVTNYLKPGSLGKILKVVLDEMVTCICKKELEGNKGFQNGLMG